MNQRLVTIVIPCYNYGALVDRAIESVLSQDYKNIELIVINDGSQDNSDEVIRNLASQHDFKYITQANKGIIFTRNLGVRLAKGEYIIQLDADDTLPLNYVDELMNAKTKNDAEIFYTRAINPEDGTTVIPAVKFSIETLKVRNYIHASAMIKASILKRNHYDTYLTDKGLEDWDINLAMCLGGARAVYVNSTYLNYTQHTRVESRGRQSRQAQTAIIAIKYVIDKYIDKYPEQMSDLQWFSDKFGKAILLNAEQVNNEKAFMQKYEKIKDELDIIKLKEEKYRLKFEEISHRKILRYYDGTIIFFKNLLTKAKQSKK